MVLAWFMDSSSEDQRLPHQLDPPQVRDDIELPPATHANSCDTRLTGARPPNRRSP